MDNLSVSNSVDVANLEALQTSQNTPPVETPPVPPAATEPELYEVKVNGQTFKVPLDELRNGYQRQQDYTKKTMEYSDYRRQADSELQQYKQRLEEVGTFLSNPQVQNALRQLQAGVTDPSKPLTAEQAMQLYQSQAEQTARAQETRLAQMAQELEVRQLAAQYTGEINTTIKGLLDKHSILQNIEGIDELLKRDVAQRQPATLEEARKLFSEAAEGRANRILGVIQNQQKQAAAQQAQLQKTGIEPPGGSALPPPPPTNFKLGSNDLFKAALEDYVKGSSKA